MEILILIAVIAVGASALYVAYTLKTRTEQQIDPLLQKTRQDILKQIEAADGAQRKQIQAITAGLQGAAGRELAEQIKPIKDELRRDGELIARLAGKIDTWPDQLRQDQLGQDQLKKELAQLDQRVAQLSESLDRQSTQLAEIHSYARSQGKPSGASAEMDPLVLATLEAESHVDRNGWGMPPRLYALTEKISPAAANHDRSAVMRDARPGGLVPVAREPLPGGDPIAALADINWPGDVVGCVLVTELTDLPPGGGEGAPVDSVAAGQWASAHPDGRPARLAVGVRRNGEYTCALRIKGEYDIQIRTDMAGDIVAALLGTF
jgi:hypothetical protein